MWHPEVLDELGGILGWTAPPVAHASACCGELQLAVLRSMRHRAACSETYARLYNTVHWLGGKKTCLQTAFEKKTPSPAGRTMDIPGTREGRLDGTAPQPSRDRRERPRIQFVRFGLPGTAGAILSRLLRHAPRPAVWDKL